MGLNISALKKTTQAAQAQAQEQAQETQVQKPKRNWDEWPKFQKELETLNERVISLRTRWINRQLNESEYQELQKLESELFEKTMQIKDF